MTKDEYLEAKRILAKEWINTTEWYHVISACFRDTCLLIGLYYLIKHVL